MGRLYCAADPRARCSRIPDVACDKGPVNQMGGTIGCPRIAPGGPAVDRMKGGSMAGSVNKVILVGNLGRDPEVRTFQNGGKVVNLRIATSERWKDRSTGEDRERTEWHSVAIFNENLGRVAEQ